MGPGPSVMLIGINSFDDLVARCLRACLENRSDVTHALAVDTKAEGRTSRITWKTRPYPSDMTDEKWADRAVDGRSWASWAPWRGHRRSNTVR